MGNTGEMKGFIFAVTFILLFTSLIGSMPTGFTGLDETPDNINPTNPNLVTDFAEDENWTKADYYYYGVLLVYDYYDLMSLDWRSLYATGGGVTEIQIASKDKWLGIWFGSLSSCEFISENGTNYGITITLDDFDNDMVDGWATYRLSFENVAKDGGSFIVSYNTTTYDNATHAWDNDELYMLHGVGITADTDVVGLLLALLFLQVPNIPVVLNLILILPVWACVVYLIWFFITSMIPFLGA